MNVARVELEGFTVHDRALVDLPERGVVVITGANGVGKSSFVEAVAWGVWGKTLRGRPPWREDALCAVSLVFRGLPVSVRRHRSPGGVMRGLQLGGAGEHETVTKAQEVLSSMVPPFPVWCRSSVFSSSDADHFTRATDGERKRLLESVLGLERFDAALAACRADLKVAEDALAAAEQDLRVSEVRLADARVAAADVPAPPSAAPDSRAPEATQLREAAVAAHQERERAAAQRGLAYARGVSLDADSAVLAARARQVSRSECPTCGQAIPAAVRAAIHAACAADRLSIDGRRHEVGREVAELDVAMADLLDEARFLERRAQDLNQAETYRRGQEHQYQAALERHKRARDQVDVLEQHRAEKEKAVEARRAGAVELRVTERILGLRGVRAHLLGSALAGLEEAANAWLARLAVGDLRVRLAVSEDKLALEIDGAGGGHGYMAASQGERRRLDVAMMLALADVARASDARSGGTLWFDECFDGLDLDGQDAVAAVLAELARDRAVVVITHSRELADRLDATARYHLPAKGR